MVEKSDQIELIPVATNSFITKIQNASKSMSDNPKKRINQIVLSILIKDYDNLKEICCEGLDEIPLARSLIWKINLKYLNLNQESWNAILKNRRLEYNEVKQAFISKLKIEKEILKELNKEELDKNYKSSLLLEIDQELKATVLKDQKLYDDIDKDIKRTHASMQFFYMPSKLSNEINSLDLTKDVERRKSNQEIDFDENKNWESNYEVLVRMLFLFSKMNIKIGYIQGMNEIIAPLYYTIYNEEKYYLKNDLYEPDVEADCFASFACLMELIGHCFLFDEKNLNKGLQAKIIQLKESLKICDKELDSHFKKINFDLEIISFKWIMLIFTQDFMLPDLIRLWDSILGDSNIYYQIILICIAILIINKQKIIKSGFSGILSILQNIGDMDVENLLNKTYELKTKYDKKLKKIIK